eukprot:scaffold8536_cov248-Pinguiococcus_pyrenoidosus.AAC.9
MRKCAGSCTKTGDGARLGFEMRPDSILITVEGGLLAEESFRNRMEEKISQWGEETRLGTNERGDGQVMGANEDSEDAVAQNTAHNGRS